MIPAWMGFGAGVGILTAAWTNVKRFFSYMTSFAVVRVNVEGHLPTAISIYCWHNLRRSPFGPRRYTGNTHFVKPLSRYANVAVEEIGKDPIIFWDGWKPLFLGARSEGRDVKDSSVSITYIRGTWKIDDLIIAATDLMNSRIKQGDRKSRFFVNRYSGGGPLAGRRAGTAGGLDGKTIQSSTKSANNDDSITNGDVRILKWKADDIGQARNQDSSALNQLAMPPEIDVLVEELRRWKDSEAWYKEKQIPWRRGWMLYGPPGTGKTSLVRAVAQDMDLPIFMFDLASMSNDELVGGWKCMMGNVPCIALFEDIDGVFDLRHNHLEERGGGLTFDCLLNVLGGIEAVDGVFTVITTNCIDKLDEALGKPRKDHNGNNNDTISTRPGRIDRAFELRELSEIQRRHIASRILADTPNEVEAQIVAGCGDSGAQFQERCGSLALRLFWESKEPEKYPQNNRAIEKVKKPFGDELLPGHTVASDDDIADMELQLSLVCSDPNITIGGSKNSVGCM